MAKSKPTNGLRATSRRAAQPDADATTAQRPPSARTARTDAQTSKPVMRRKSRAASAPTLKATPHLRKVRDGRLRRLVSNEQGDGRGGCAAQVRVWWPPTRDKRKTDYGGAYWPAKVTGRTDKGFRVEYDNGDIEVTHPENISPLEVPVEFGQETARLRVSFQFRATFSHSSVMTHSANPSTFLRLGAAWGVLRSVQWEQD